MNRKAAARLDAELDHHVRVGLLAPEPASAPTTHSSATVLLTRSGREVRLEERTPVSDQGELGSCYANAWCDAMELLQPEGRVVQLSRLFAWYNARLANGDQDRDEGTFGAVLSSRQRTIGVCRESSWAYDPRPLGANERAFVRPPLSAYEEAYDHRAGVSYVVYGNTLAERVRAAKEHLEHGYPLVVAFAVSDAWDDPAEVITPPRPAEVTGYHAVIIDGYVEKPDGVVWFDVRNSWGESWARQGHVYVSAEYLARRVCDRIDVVTLAPDFGRAAP